MAKRYRRRHRKYRSSSLMSSQNRIAEQFGNIAPLVLIGISVVILIYLFFNPGFPLFLKYRTPLVWEEWRRRITEYQAVPGFFMRYCSWFLLARLADTLLMILFLPVRLILGILMPLLENVMPSVVRITVYAVPIIVIIWQLQNPVVEDFLLLVKEKMSGFREDNE